jgi:DNA-binding IclR family transcriptional regulator
VALVEGDTLHWAARAQGATQGLRYDPPMGRSVLLHATASGKAWLATLPEDQALGLVLRQGFRGRPGMGKRAARTVDEFRRHLREARRRGYALAIDEAEPGIVAIAAAFATGGTAGAATAGAISVAGPGVRFDVKRATELGPRVLAAARAMTALWPTRRRQRTSPGLDPHSHAA